MENPMRARVLSRLSEMGLRPSSQEIRDKLVSHGLNKTYLYEFVSGKKAQINLNNLPAIADVLGVDVEYLTGEVAGTAPDGVRIVGICEAGAWRAQRAHVHESLKIAPDRRYPVSSQEAYLVHGNHAENLGIPDGSVLVIAKDIHPRAGEIMVARRDRDDGTSEVFAARYEGQVPDQPGFRIVGIVLMAVRMF